MKKFDIPAFYRSPIISKIKEIRKQRDRMKTDFTPTTLDFGPIVFHVARHFGFCYGVENAIEIVYRTIDENPGKRIFLLSEMIHNPHVNEDLQSMGVQFMQDTYGNQLLDWDELNENDIAVIPAFGTTTKIEQLLKDKNINIEAYDTTCPFVEKVWKRSAKLGHDDYTVVIHGKPQHEETRATFSHSATNAHSIVIRDIEEARILADFINNKRDWADFDNFFAERYTEGFNPKEHLKRIGVVNQTTMLASDTQEIADFLGGIVTNLYGTENYADTRDTLCYATSDNQNAVYGLLDVPADFAIVVGGYNSSNTSHLVELCEQKLTTFHISGPAKLLDEKSISHFVPKDNKESISALNLKSDKPIHILLTSGASCPDATVDQIIERIISFVGDDTKDKNVVLETVEKQYKD